MTLKEILNRWNQWVWRQRLRRQVAWARSAPTRWMYAETRPIPLARFKTRELPITTDCSGFVTGLFYAAGAPDPNHQGYDGEGYTGTMLDYLRAIAKSSLRFGDLIVFGSYPGVHVVMVIEPGRSPDWDPVVLSHGRPGLDVMALSRMTLDFPGQPVTCLSAFVPKGDHTT